LTARAAANSTKIPCAANNLLIPNKAKANEKSGGADSMNILDIIILITILIFAFFGFRRGLVLSIISLTSVIISFIAAKLLYIKLAVFLASKTDWDTKINLFITGKLTKSFPGGHVSLSSGDSGSSVQWIITKLFHSETIINDTINSVALQITNVILHVISFVMIFVAVLIIIKIIGLILNKLSKLPVLGFVNKLGGSVIGLIKGSLLCMLIVSVASSLSIFTNSPAVINLLNNSLLCKYFYIGNWLF
jgi:uncharacterized membrane protein required for colicin V production